MGEKVEKSLNSLISEYLTSRGYLKTVATLQSEAAVVSNQSHPPLGSVHPEFLEAFEGGERQAFFELWNEHIPSPIQSSSSTCQHLECSIIAYFAVYPLHTGIGKFRSYLDNRGSIISRNQELAVYFALPYIPDLSKHPSHPSRTSS